MSDEKFPPTAMIIWGAMMASAVSYGGIALVAAKSIEAPADAATTQLLTQVFGLVAMSTLAASFLLRPMLAKVMPLLPYMLVRWALGETAAIFGLVLRFLGAADTVMASFIGASVLALLLSMPNETERDRYLELRKR